MWGVYLSRCSLLPSQSRSAPLEPPSGHARVVSGVCYYYSCCERRSPLDQVVGSFLLSNFELRMARRFGRPKGDGASFEPPSETWEPLSREDKKKEPNKKGDDDDEEVVCLFYRVPS